MVHYMLRPEVKLYAQGEHGETAGGKGPIWKTHYVFNRRFERMRELLHLAAALGAGPSRAGAGGFRLFVADRCCLAAFIGRDFFPTVDSGQMRLHARAPSGTRIEQTEVLLRRYRERDPPGDSAAAKSTPSSTTSAFPTAASTWPLATTPRSASGDGDILISLDPENHGPTADVYRPLAQAPARASSPTWCSFSKPPTSPTRF